MVRLSTSTRRGVLAVLALAAVTVAALLFTSGPPAGAASGPTTVKLTANAQGKLKFNTSKVSVPHGKVTLTMKNPSSSGIPHGIAVEGKGVDKDGKVVQPGSTSKVSATLKKGTYEFYCPFDGHKAAGMTGKLTVK
jgi:uncharacterized cupredoxin-like copper-binding protein